MTVRYVALGIIIDDIVFPDGTTRTGLLGGGGAQTAWGMALAAASGDEVGMVSGVGQDFPAESLAPLTAMGINVSGVHVTDLPTPRAWQLLEPDGGRQHIWRVNQSTSDQQTHPSAATILRFYPDARVVTWGIHPENPHLAPSKPLREHGITVCIEPFKGLPEPLSATALHAILSQCDIFSPNWLEAVSLFGTTDRAVMAQRARAAGASLLALRKGAHGAEVWDFNQDRGAAIPAAPVKAVIDPVGAGDAFCGAFCATWHATHDLVQAGINGAVAASFMLEQIGMPPGRPPGTLVVARQQAVAAGVQEFGLSVLP